jgi:hypothetical protein
VADQDPSPTERLVRLLLEQAEGCDRLGSPFTAELLRRVAADVRSGGPSAVVLAGHELDPGPAALGLRLVGTIHRLVLAGEAPDLAAHYPSGGGDADVAAAWPLVTDLMRVRLDHLRAGLLSPPQTNEVGRAAALVGGLLHVVDRFPLPVRLHEIGASGGLNLRADYFRIESQSGVGWGPVNSPVVLPDAWHGGQPPVSAQLRVVERSGCDLSPIDATTRAGELLLSSYVWPDQMARFERLRGAIEVARRVPATVVTQGAGSYVHSLELRLGTVLVLWHSVMWQYLDRVERAGIERRLEEVGAAATEDSPLAHLLLEPRRARAEGTFDFLVVLRTWPGGDERVLATTVGHGLPVTWE